jgi:RimJ/RimL family protein N-acetyltransferase
MKDMQAVLRPAPGTLTGDRVVVRAYRDDDAQEVYAAIQESVEHNRPWLLWYDSHRSVEDTLAYLRRTQAHFILREGFEMGMFSHSGRYLGGSGLHVHDWRIPAFEIGYWVRRSEEGKGYVTEAARLLTQCAFETLEAERVTIQCDARNVRSAAVAERLEFVFEGTARHAGLNTSGELADILTYSLLREEYEKLPR